MVRKRRLIDLISDEKRRVESSSDRLFASLEAAKGRGTVSRIKVAGVYEEFSSVQFVGGKTNDSRFIDLVLPRPVTSTGYNSSNSSNR